MRKSKREGVMNAGRGPSLGRRKQMLGVISLRLFGSACVAAMLAFPALAYAGPPGTWTQVTGPGIGVNGSNTDELGLARTGDGVLHVAWTQAPNGSYNDGLMHSTISADGKAVSGPDTILSGFEFNNSVDLLLSPDGGLRVFFAGLNPGSPLDDLLATATAGADGKTWSVQPTPVSNSSPDGNHPVYAASGIGGGLAADGTPIGAWGDSTPDGGAYHLGLSNETPDVEFPPTLGDLGPDAATGADGQLVLARNDIAPDPARLVAKLLPSGEDLVAPNSGATQFRDRVSISGRSGGKPGVYIGYTSGDNPFTGFPTIWKVGDAGATRVSKEPGAESTKLSPAPNGAFWMMWKNDNLIFARRSNPDLTEWGGTVKVRPPKGTDTVYDVIGEGSGAASMPQMGPLGLRAVAPPPRGLLDLLANLDRGGALGYWHQRILPGLSIRSSRRKVDSSTGGEVRFEVEDAGKPVSGATVSFRGKSKRTNSKGEVEFEVPAGSKTGKKEATAEKNGYSEASTTVKIKK